MVFSGLTHTTFAEQLRMIDKEIGFKDGPYPKMSPQDIFPSKKPFSPLIMQSGEILQAFQGDTKTTEGREPLVDITNQSGLSPKVKNPTKALGRKKIAYRVPWPIHHLWSSWERGDVRRTMMSLRSGGDKARLPMWTKQTLYWRRLWPSPIGTNELLELELSWAWEPMYSSGARKVSAGKRSLGYVPNRNMVKNRVFRDHLLSFTFQ